MLVDSDLGPGLARPLPQQATHGHKTTVASIHPRQSTTLQSELCTPSPAHPVSSRASQAAGFGLSSSLTPGPEPCDHTGLCAGCAVVGVTGVREWNRAWVTWRSRGTVTSGENVRLWKETERVWGYLGALYGTHGEQVGL